MPSVTERFSITATFYHKTYIISIGKSKMTITTEKQNVLHLGGAEKHFVPEQIFDCGQCFRFEKVSDGRYGGVAFGRYIEVTLEDGIPCIYGAVEGDYALWSDYFDMELDYGKVAQSFSHDKTLCEAAKVGCGIRILHQDEFETLISFIISQNNNIPRIKGIISNLCKTYGEPFCDAWGNIRYSFPTPERIYNAGEDGMSKLRMGFRAKYVIDAVTRILDGRLVLSDIYGMPTSDALEYLMQVKGVGLKVASCAALFAFKKYDSFPVDVWVKRILDKYYGGHENVSAAQFGEYGGIAQQYLFYYERCQNGVYLS